MNCWILTSIMFDHVDFQLRWYIYCYLIGDIIVLTHRSTSSSVSVPVTDLAPSSSISSPMFPAWMYVNIFPLCVLIFNLQIQFNSIIPEYLYKKIPIRYCHFQIYYKITYHCFSFHVTPAIPIMLTLFHFCVTIPPLQHSLRQ